MVRIDDEVDEAYGKFVQNRLIFYIERKNRKKIIEWRFDSEDKKKKADEYNKKYERYEHAMDVWYGIFSARRNNNIIQQKKHWLFLTFFLLSIFWLLMMYLLMDPFLFSDFICLTIILGLSIMMFYPVLSENIINLINSKLVTEPNEEDIMRDKPKPKPPSEKAPKPTIAIEFPAQKIIDDDYYYKYCFRFKKYKSQVICPVCNSSLIVAPDTELPYQAQCIKCEYFFTVIYQQRKELYKTKTVGPRGGVKVKKHYITYDGIKAIKPKTQDIKLIKQEMNIKDSIIYKSQIAFEGDVNIEDSIVK